MKRNYKCGNYLRLSKEDDLKKDESSSIANQRMINTSFANYAHLEIVKEYVDDGFSGGNFERPAFKQMLEDIEQGKINCVITKDLSRLGREIYQTGLFIEDFFNQKGVRYIAVNDGYDSLNGDNMLAIRLGVNDLYLRDISKKVKTSFKALQKEGKYLGSIACYGYLKDPSDHHHLIVDPEAACIVKRIYTLALEGNSPYMIAKILTNNNIPIPIVYKQETRAMNVTDNNGLGIWKPQTIRRILTNEMYIGNMVQNTFNKIRYNSKKKRQTVKTDWIIVKNTHEAIIDYEVFKKVQEILKKSQKQTAKKTSKYLFTGLLKCHECGHNISILEKTNKKNKSHYTQCNLYSKKGKYGKCSIHRINYNYLEEDLISLIGDSLNKSLKKLNYQKLTNKINNIYNQDLNKLQTSIASLTKSIVKSKQAIEQLYMDKVNNKIPVEIFESLLAKYSFNITKNLNLKKDFENQKKLLNQNIPQIDYNKSTDLIKHIITNPQTNRAFICSLIDKIEIIDNKNEEIKIKVYFNYQKN